MNESMAIVCLIGAFLAHLYLVFLVAQDSPPFAIVCLFVPIVMIWFVVMNFSEAWLPFSIVVGLYFASQYFLSLAEVA